MKRKTLFLIVLFTSIFGFASDISLDVNAIEKKPEHQKGIFIAVNDNEDVGDETEKTNTQDTEKSVPSNRQYASPAALIIVILIFVVLFAWPPIFMKLVEKKEKEKEI